MIGNELKFGFVGGGTRAAAERYESLGIDSLWCGGHIASPNPTPEAMVQLARLAALTERVRIGTSILLMPLYQPAIVAKQIADLDNQTGGRVTLGVGVGGEYPAEFRAVGVPLEERGSRTNEAIPLLRKLWTAEPVTHHGKHYAFEDVKIHPAPVQGTALPIIVSGRQPVAMRRAAALGDGWLPYLFSARRYAESVVTIREHADKIGRDLTNFEWLAFIFVNVDADRAKARAAAAAMLGGNYRQDFDAMLDRVAVAGDVEMVKTKLQEYVDAGARHIVATIADRDQERHAYISDTLVHDVFPALSIR